MMALLANDDVDVDDEDVKFVLAQCDDDGNGAISRDELLPTVAMWSQMVNSKTRRSSQGSQGEWRSSQGSQGEAEMRLSQGSQGEAPEEATPREAPREARPAASDAKAGEAKAPPEPKHRGSSTCGIM